MWDKLEAVERRYEELGRLMAEPEVVADRSRLAALAKEQSSLEELVSLYREYRAAEHDLAEARALLDDADEELRALANAEVGSLLARLEELTQALKQALLPQDPNDERSVIMEIRAGAGGEEAGLFAADLFRVYTRYAEARGWRVDVLSRNDTGIGGLKEIVLEVQGRGVYSRFKYESGVHRVQRVPVTEASGRIHTSTATVAVLPEAEEVEVEIDPEDLRIDIFHASGHGGQNVQKVATAVRITHIPTGIVATCQDERSQLRNRQRAMAVLRARLLDIERSRQREEVTTARRSQVGSGDRAEKIRTYNFPQNRVTDHRIGRTLHNLSAILEGDLDQLIDAAVAQEQERLLEEILA